MVDGADRLAVLGDLDVHRTSHVAVIAERQPGQRRRIVRFEIGLVPRVGRGIVRRDTVVGFLVVYDPQLQIFCNRGQRHVKGHLVGHCLLAVFDNDICALFQIPVLQAEVDRVVGLAVFLIGAIGNRGNRLAKRFRHLAVSGIIGVALRGRDAEADPVVI